MPAVREFNEIASIGAFASLSHRSVPVDILKVTCSARRQGWAASWEGADTLEWTLCQAPLLPQLPRATGGEMTLNASSGGAIAGPRGCSARSRSHSFWDMLKYVMLK